MPRNDFVSARSPYETSLSMCKKPSRGTNTHPPFFCQYVEVSERKLTGHFDLVIHVRAHSTGLLQLTMLSYKARTAGPAKKLNRGNWTACSTVAKLSSCGMSRSRASSQPSLNNADCDRALLYRILQSSAELKLIARSRDTFRIGHWFLSLLRVAHPISRDSMPVASCRRSAGARSGSQPAAKGYGKNTGSVATTLSEP